MTTLFVPPGLIGIEHDHIIRCPRCHQANAVFRCYAKICKLLVGCFNLYPNKYDCHFCAHAFSWKVE